MGIQVNPKVYLSVENLVAADDGTWVTLPGSPPLTISRFMRKLVSFYDSALRLLQSYQTRFATLKHMHCAIL